MPAKRKKRTANNPWPFLAGAVLLIALGVGYAALGSRGNESAATPAQSSSRTAQTTLSEETPMTARKTPTKTKTKARTPTKTPTRKPSASATRQATRTRTSTRKPTATATPQSAGGAAYSQQVFQAVNRYRDAQGRPALAWDDRLGAFAQSRADDMIARNYFSHNDPKTGALILGQLGSRTANGETLYQLEGGVSAYLEKIDDLAVADWKNSPPHAAIMGDRKMTRAGVGVAVAARRVVVVLIVEQ